MIQIFSISSNGAQIHILFFIKFFQRVTRKNKPFFIEYILQM